MGINVSDLGLGVEQLSDFFASGPFPGAEGRARGFIPIGSVNNPAQSGLITNVIQRPSSKRSAKTVKKTALAKVTQPQRKKRTILGEDRGGVARISLLGQ